MSEPSKSEDTSKSTPSESVNVPKMSDEEKCEQVPLYCGSKCCDNCVTGCIDSCLPCTLAICCGIFCCGICRNKPLPLM